MLRKKKKNPGVTTTTTAKKRSLSFRPEGTVCDFLTLLIGSFLVVNMRLWDTLLHLKHFSTNCTLVHYLVLIVF